MMPINILAVIIYLTAYTATRSIETTVEVVERLNRNDHQPQGLYSYRLIKIVIWNLEF